MANTFRRITYDITDTLVDFYTVPAATTTIVIGCQVANVTPNDASTLTFALDDGSSVFNLVEEVVVPANAALNPIAGKLVLEAGDELLAQASDNNELVLVLSILEQD